ncbi:DUF6456 domain-containing protein [Rubrimonas cliftonensis]|uniref:DUF6456 domain-containing protein n=1 Tax=Rubrimonas cliftonensis TaxID=89524 RepID=A0A1H3YBE5_9RHOB|nr:DUF6456 domain-containing protein [Rubrimonas cliftonensis]SEA08242.1 hypothetical protein SAMN05444370_1034 [Rubrimonas cliftonensis]
MRTHHVTLRACVSAMRASLAEAPPRRVEDAALYLAHVEGAAPLRRLAEAAGKAPASVHRAIRRMEALRDDPLIDRALETLGAVARGAMGGVGCADDGAAPGARDDGDADGQSGAAAPALISDYGRRVAARALERLSEPEAFLMIADGAGKAGVFCRKNRFRRPLGLLTLEAAAELAARDWVRCLSRTNCSAKYVISEAGRAWLRTVLAREAENQPAAPAADCGEGPAEPTPAPQLRACLAETPLAWLATRRGADGAPFLTPAEVEAGERLVGDFEAAHLAGEALQDWRGLVAPRAPGGDASPPVLAADRFGRALEALGPGLADAALRTCCLREGLESTERRMGWSARSGKVVLKIALQRLSDHYGLTPAAARGAGTVAMLPERAA